MQKQMIVYLALAATALLGLGGLIAGVQYPARWQNYKARAIVVEAVIHVGTGSKAGRYAAYVDYRAGGREYQDKELPNWLYDSRNSKDGDTVTIYVDPDNPSRFRVEDPVSPVMFKVLGIFFLLAGAIPLTVMTTRAFTARQLMGSGHKVMADIVEVAEGNAFKNGEQSKHVICEWRDGHEPRRFKSRILWTDPSGAIARKGIKRLPVYIDPKNPRRYFVDTSVLLEHIE